MAMASVVRTEGWSTQEASTGPLGLVVGGDHAGGLAQGCGVPREDQTHSRTLDPPVDGDRAFADLEGLLKEDVDVVTVVALESLRALHPHVGEANGVQLTSGTRGFAA